MRLNRYSLRCMSLARPGVLLILLLTAGRVEALPKVKVIFVRYNLLQEGEELSVVKNNPVKAGQINRVVLTLFNTGAKDYRSIDIKPVSKDRYLNIRLADRTTDRMTLRNFGAGALKTIRGKPLIITVAPTCPDEYKGKVYLYIEAEGCRRTIRQFVVEVSNSGILKGGQEEFSDLYGGLGVKPPPSKRQLDKEIREERTPARSYRSGRNKSRKGRSSESVNRTIKKYQMEVYYCYQQQLRKYQDLAGKVIIKFTVRPFGNVINIKVVRSTLNNKAVEQCLVRRIKTWKFPTIHKSNGNLDITYPFVFDNIPKMDRRR